MIATEADYLKQNNFGNTRSAKHLDIFEYFKSKLPPKSLNKLVCKSKSWQLREWLVGNITDEKVLSRAAECDPHSDVVRAALTRLPDDSKVHYSVAKKHPEALVRERAVTRITDQDFLLHVAQTDLNMFVRHEALRRITKADALKRIFDTAVEKRDRRLARQRLEALAKADGTELNVP